MLILSTQTQAKTQYLLRIKQNLYYHTNLKHLKALAFALLGR